MYFNELGLEYLILVSTGEGAYGSKSDSNERRMACS